MTKIEQRHTKSSRIRNLIGFSAFFIMVFCGVVFYQGTQAHKEAMQKGEHSSKRLAHILADHVELTFLGSDLLLRRAIERQYFNTLFGNNLPEYTEQYFKVWLNETPQVVAMAMINEDGAVAVAAHKKNYDHWLDYHKTMIGQKFFEHMRDADDTDVFIGQHYTEDKASLIIMSRRYNKLDGEFGGIVVVAINPDYFIDFYDSIATGKQKFMALMQPPQMLTDGSLNKPLVLASGPYESDIDLELSRTLLKQQSKNQEDTISKTFALEDTVKIVAIRQVKNMPIIISVVRDKDDFLFEWHQSVMKDVSFIVLFVVFGSILSYFAITMAKQILRVEESEGAAILASQAKSEFLANMSHELRTPLNAIIGFSEMINSGYFGPLNAKQKERIHDINLCGSHLLQLITDILEFSKGDAGKLELVEEKVDVAEIINEGVRIMNGKIKTKGINLVLAIEVSLPFLWGDKRKIRQILLNLLSNAMKFTPEHGTITIAAKMDTYHNMQLMVSDTGIGISESDIPKALSVFGQVHRNKSNEGTGLGLPLCKMYAELHDGKLVLTSRLGEGTNVLVIFPHQRTLVNKREG